MEAARGGGGGMNQGDAGANTFEPSWWPINRSPAISPSLQRLGCWRRNESQSSTESGAESFGEPSVVEDFGVGSKRKLWNALAPKNCVTALSAETQATMTASVTLRGMWTSQRWGLLNTWNSINIWCQRGRNHSASNRLPFAFISQMTTQSEPWAKQAVNSFVMRWDRRWSISKRVLKSLRSGRSSCSMSNKTICGWTYWWLL